MHISQLELWSIFEKNVLNFKRIAFATKDIQSYWLLATLIMLTSDIYSVTLPELPKRMIVWELCWRQWGNLRPNDNDWNNSIEQCRLRTRSMVNDLFCITEYRPSLGFEKGTRQICLLSSCNHGHTLAGNLQMMMIMIFVITNIV